MLYTTISDIKNVMIGGTQASALYLGNNLLWPISSDAYEVRTITALNNIKIDYSCLMFLAIDGTSYPQYSFDGGTTWLTGRSEISPNGTDISIAANSSFMIRAPFTFQHYLMGHIEDDQVIRKTDGTTAYAENDVYSSSPDYRVSNSTVAFTYIVDVTTTTGCNVSIRKNFNQYCTDYTAIPNAVYYSTDDGSTWTEMTTNLTLNANTTTKFKTTGTNMKQPFVQKYNYDESQPGQYKPTSVILSGTIEQLNGTTITIYRVQI